jgi:cellobiose-specific phosphotransferase system component IIC
MNYIDFSEPILHSQDKLYLILLCYFILINIWLCGIHECYTEDFKE